MYNKKAWDKIVEITKKKLNLLDPRELNAEEMRRVQEHAKQHVNLVDRQMKLDELNNLILARLTFEKGKVGLYRKKIYNTA
jgi:hypothetical protein